MTVIAFDGETIAADGQSTNGSTIVELTKKKLRIVDGPHGRVCIGGAGDSAALEAFIEWYQDETKAFPHAGTGTDFTALVVKADGTALIYRECIKTPIKASIPVAIGDGMDIAIGALLALVPANAVAAVEIACARNIYCGGDIQRVSVLDLYPIDMNDTLCFCGNTDAHHIGASQCKHNRFSVDKTLAERMTLKAMGAYHEPE